jgi:hypothetical protein
VAEDRGDEDQREQDATEWDEVTHARRKLHRACPVRPRYAVRMVELLGALATVEDIVRRPDLMIVEIVVQDEYTHDVVTRHAQGEHYYVFDTT